MSRGTAAVPAATRSARTAQATPVQDRPRSPRARDTAAMTKIAIATYTDTFRIANAVPRPHTPNR
jgi:hypothetical protein